MIYGNKKQIRTPQRPSHTVKPTRKKQAAACTTRRPRRMVISKKGKHKRERTESKETFNLRNRRGYLYDHVRRVRRVVIGIREELTSLPLESVDDVQRGDGLPLGVLSVCDSITDDTLKEGLEDTTGLLVDHGGDTLDTTTACETTDSGLGDTLDVVT